MYPVPTEAGTQGRTDRYIGSWLQASPARRQKLILATKVAGTSERITWLRDSGKARAAQQRQRSCARMRTHAQACAEQQKHPQGTRVDRANIIESVEKSLTRLGTDYIDLLQARPYRGRGCLACMQSVIAAPRLLCVRVLTHAAAAVPQIHWPDRCAAGRGAAMYRLRARVFSLAAACMRMRRLFLRSYVPLFGGAAYDVALERDAVPIRTQLAALAELVAAGKARASSQRAHTPSPLALCFLHSRAPC
jgi:aryl-alcohol dehydrogenase-like predicted oxidoreductase